MLLIAALALSYLLANLKKSQLEAFDQSVLALDHSQQLAQKLSHITSDITKLNNEIFSERVIELRTQIIQRASLLRHVVSELNLDDISDQVTTDELQQLLRSLENSVIESAEIKLNTIELDEIVKSQLSEIARLRASFNDVIKPMSIDISSAIGNTISSITTNTNVPTPSLASFLQKQFNDQEQLLGLSYRMSALMDSIDVLLTKNDHESHAEVSNRLQFTFTSITQNLINFGDIESRRKLAVMIKELRKLTISQDGILNYINSIRVSESALKIANANQLDIIKNISDAIDGIVISSKSEFAENIASYFTNILQAILAISIVVGFSIFSLVVFVNYFVVERQISQRMLQLTSAVTDIANGDNDRNVNVSGTDEIGIIADALEIFKKNAKELNRSNMELEQFAYSASHDLKSPLRAIESLAQWTLEDAGDDLPADAKSNLEQLLSRARRLSQLQTDLLEYSKAGKLDSNVEELDLSQVVEKLADLLDPERHFDIKATPITDALLIHITPFRQILMNLINNAIKHHDRTSGEIQISAQVYQDRLIVSIIDDGPGIEKKYQEKIFGLFEKLESRDCVEGSGLGLSLVKKMIEGRSGHIFIESDPSRKRGSTFTFDWPIAEYLPDQKKVA